MRQHTLRKDVVESNFTLPVTAIVTLLLWVIAPKWDGALWGTLLLMGAMTYVIVEWNNQCQLLRIRSRMNSVTFLTLMSMFPVLHDVGVGLIPAFSLIGAYFMLFKAYGLYKPQGYVFHAFFFLSVGSLFFPPLLLVALTLLVSCSVQLRVLTLQSFSATVLGLLLPYWLYAAVMAVGMNLWEWNETRLDYLHLQLPDYSQFAQWQWFALGFLGLIGIVSVFSFVISSYNDKIRTRQYFYTMLMSLAPVVFITFWWTDDFCITLPLLLTALTPFVAHYMALAKGRSMRYWFWVWLLLAVAIGVANRFDLYRHLPSCPEVSFDGFFAACGNAWKWVVEECKNIVELWKHFIN